MFEITGKYNKAKIYASSADNNIDVGAGILCKGAVSAQKGEKILIPINMRDGSLLCIGKGNDEWNYKSSMKY